MPLRDLAVTLVVAALLTLVFKHPVIGAYLWAWLSLMNPHKMAYGFAFNFPFAQIAAVMLLIALLVTKKKQALPLHGIVIVQLLFLFWMSVTSPFAMAPSDLVLQRWIFVLKVHLMLLVTWMLVLDAKQLRGLIWVVCISIGFFGVKGGVWTVLTGGGDRVWGPPGGMLQGNNELAVALVMLMPLLHFLRETEPNAWIRRLLLFSMVAIVFSILGSQSRGALVAIMAMAFFLGLKSKHPFRTSLALLALAALAIGFMPVSWSDRMETMRTFEGDTSAMSRIWSWRTFWNAAVDRPLIGAGFAADDPTVFARYAPLDGEFAIFKGQVYVAHSIYFQVLGEHGFVGLGLFLLLGLVTWFTAGRIARQTQSDGEFGSWMPLLMRMVQVSLIGYAVGGAFLNLAYVDLPYYVMGFVVSAGALIRARTARHATPPAPAPDPTGKAMHGGTKGQPAR